jgi:copper transport protein
LVGVLAAVLLASALALLAGADPAVAHATLVGTVPAGDEVIDAVPELVELRFDEAVEVVDDAVRVIGPDGDRADLADVETDDGGATLRAPIEGATEGTYTVAWRVTSEDSHALSGSFVFHVGSRTGAADIGDEDDTTTEVAGGVGRWLGFAGTFVAVGAAALALAAGRVDERVRRRVRPLAVGGAAVAALGVLLALVAMVAEGAGRGLVDAIDLVPDLAPDTRTGRLALARAGLCLAAAVTAAPVAVWRRSSLPTLVLGAASLATASLAGHAWTAPSRGLALAADMIHLAAVALWIGGLVALLVALPVSADRSRLAARFSAGAVALVVVVAATGAVSGWEQVRTFHGLTSTTYGQLLIAKVGGFVALVAVGWANRARLVPLAGRTVAPLTRSLRAETAVAGAVLALTAALVHQPPARATAPGPFTATVAAEPEGALGEDTGATDGARLDVTVDPARAGSNDIHLYFLDRGGGPLAVDAVEVSATTTGVPARRLPVTPVTADHVTVAGASLPSPGTWTVAVTAVRAGTPLDFTFEVPIT